MALSNSYAFNPSLGETVLYAYGRCGIRRTEITQSHMADAHIAANMVCADFSNKGVNLWQVTLISTPLVQGTATYNVDPSVVVILDAYITISSAGQPIDRYILPISRTEYVSYSNKQQQGFPTTYWLDRLLAPTVTLWPVPDGNEATLNTYVLKQLQDANYTNGQNIDVPYLWLKAFSDALSVELAVIWAPDRLVHLAPMAAASYATAADQNVESAQFYLSPQISGYFR